MCPPLLSVLSKQRARSPKPYNFQLSLHLQFPPEISCILLPLFLLSYFSHLENLCSLQSFTIFLSLSLPRQAYPPFSISSFPNPGSKVRKVNEKSSDGKSAQAMRTQAELRKAGWLVTQEGWGTAAATHPCILASVLLTTCTLLCLSLKRIYAKSDLKELQQISPARRWCLVEIDASLSDLKWEIDHVISLIDPSKTYMGKGPTPRPTQSSFADADE